MKDDGTPILVVSDMHFGRGLPSQLSCRDEEFAKFLEWVLHNRTVLLDRAHWTRRKLPFPRKMVLLGDILELWAPLSDRIVFKTAYAPLAKLQEVGAKGCEIVYIMGNHDYSLSEYQGQYGVTDLPGVPSLQLIDDLHLSGRFVFLHGHQLVKSFRFPFWRALGFIRGLVASFGETLKRAIVLIFVMAVVAWYFSQQAVLMQISVALGILTVLIAIRELAFPAFILSKRLSKIAEKMETWLYGKMRERPQYKEFSEIIGEGSLQDWWNECKVKFANEPEVIIFGHTHRYDGPIKVEDVPGIDLSEVSDELRKKILVNTGCWLREEEEDSTSFLYITKKGEMLLCGYDASRNLGVELPGELTRFASRQMPWSASIGH